MEAADDVWSRVRNRAGVKGRDQTIHLLRHTTATRLARSGVALPILQKILNHASAATTSRYYQLDSNPGRDALQKYAPRFGQLVSTLAPKELLAVEEDDDPGSALV